MAGIVLYCPFCGEQVGAHALLNSGLGPSLVACDVTGETFRTGRKEWAKMGVLRRAWYVLMSCTYVLFMVLCVVGGGGAGLGRKGIQPQEGQQGAEGGEQRAKLAQARDLWVALAGIAITGGTGAAVQVARALRSAGPPLACSLRIARHGGCFRGRFPVHCCRCLLASAQWHWPSVGCAD